MTAMIDHPSPASDLDLDWRSKAVCDPSDTESHFQTVEDLVEDGVPQELATEMVAYAEQRAKATCSRCPVMDKCRTWALENGEEFGIWGGTTPAERAALRPEWPAIKKITYLPVEPLPGEALHEHNGVDTRYRNRLVKARLAHEMLSSQPEFAVFHRRVGHQGRQACLDVVDAIIANPSTPTTDLAARIGKSSNFFSQLFSLVCRELGI
ncbi:MULTISPECIES: WhiB family transcriptional regulator [Mycobacteroides]|uniref:WhiB family transcriptional regulator n=1 Tax=Mycobacteroides TaxID=670516 RepID=UPI0009937551|nr:MULTISPECIES: WhiB family transcriptional regulator [Mycobacteroides]SKK36907.1 transcriptional regulator [Mycobacteroides abscessus subsp. massiliense]SKM34982.1 transcriptional regulator [Mycobacteroides abscessus subsp. massiliense]SKP08743.1 transcriptional regulator [Mycobacteroides abscessus subsp. massiliense]SKP94534.1 transcriptional regulator [Mycobacteroides abscessus subsp. massiliense]SLK59662.1 transcriptional regulator [Mycobacteroides abscessus subsp. massiliense]